MDNLLEKLDKTPIKANTTQLINLKIALNDLLMQFLKINNCTEYCRDKDIKIIVGLSSAVLAISTTYVSMNFDFDVIKLPLLVMVVIYFVINGGLEVYERFLANYMYLGVYKNKKLLIHSNVHDSNLDYKLIIKYDDETRNYTKSVFTLFYEDGVLDHKIFLKDMDEVFTFFK